MNIRILGNGGAISDGLPYNAFLTDGYFLTETPPDIMGSLYRERVAVSEIRTIFISHFHADHYFGFPFLALRLFFNGITEPITIIGPPGVNRRLNDLCALSFGAEHPLMGWLEKTVHCMECRSGSRIEISSGISITAFPTFHFTETYGYTLHLRTVPAYTYLADTTWHEELTSRVLAGGKIIIADLNGEPTDPVPVHLTEMEAATHLLPHCPAGTTIYGTHLKMSKVAQHPGIQYLNPGDCITL